MIRHAMLAGLLAGCSHPLPPVSPPGFITGPSGRVYLRNPHIPLEPVQPAPATTPAPAKPVPPPTRTPNPFDSVPLVPDPAYPEPTLPPDARAT